VGEFEFEFKIEFKFKFYVSTPALTATLTLTLTRIKAGQNAKQKGLYGFKKKGGGKGGETGLDVLG
jgi:hypothetical protein